MQENNFEKNIQQRMDGFDLLPSDAVWERVEREIRKKKRRRVIIFFFLLAGLGALGYGSVYFLSADRRQHKQVVQQEAPVNVLPPAKDRTNDDKTNSDRTKNDRTNDDKTNNDKIKDDRTKNNDDQLASNDSIGSFSRIPAKQERSENNTGASKSPAIPVKDGSVIHAGNHKSNDISAKNNARGNKKNDLRSTDQLTAAGKGSNDIPVSTGRSIKNNGRKITREEQALVSPPTSKQPPGAGPLQQNTAAKKNELIKQTPVTDTSGKADLAQEKAPVKLDTTAIAQNKAVTDTSVATPSPVVANKNKKAKKITWGMEAAVGTTGNQRSIFSGLKTREVLNNSAPSAGVGSGGAAFVYPPSNIRNGLAYRIGITGEKKIGKRSSFSTGLQYTYMSNRIKVGTRRADSVTLTPLYSSAIVVKNTYQGAPVNNHTNGYHFLQLPLAYHLQLNKGKRTPLTLDINTSLGYLLSTSALIYNQGNGGIYYKDRSAYNKLHFMAGTGLSIAFNNKRGEKQWAIGPDLSLDFTRQMKSSLVDGRYFLFGGMHVKWFLPKKK